jgi:hypothetical protein
MTVPRTPWRMAVVRMGIAISALPMASCGCGGPEQTDTGFQFPEWAQRCLCEFDDADRMGECVDVEGGDFMPSWPEQEPAYRAVVEANAHTWSQEVSAVVVARDVPWAEGEDGMGPGCDEQPFLHAWLYEDGELRDIEESELELLPDATDKDAERLDVYGCFNVMAVEHDGDLLVWTTWWFPPWDGEGNLELWTVAGDEYELARSCIVYTT